VLPLLEYNSVIWSPSLIKGIDLIEQVQRRFTKRLRCLDGVAYTDRLQCLNLPSLELRRLYLDLVFCYKIVFDIVHINSDDLFTFSTVAHTRGHGYKLYKPRLCKSSVRRNFFIERIINVWNFLPHTVDFHHCLNLSGHLIV